MAVLGGAAMITAKLACLSNFLCTYSVVLLGASTCHSCSVGGAQE